MGDIYTCVIEKYTADGELDSSFADNGILEIPFAGTNDYSVIDVEIISNGSFLIFYKEDDGSTSSYRVMKLDSGGLVDLSYGNNGMSEIIPVGPSFGGRTLVSYPDGSCFLNFSYWDSTNDEFIHTLFKLTASGFIDTVFGNQGEKEGSDAKIVQENGRVIADNPTYDWEGGYYMDYHRFYQDGFVDPSFTFDPPISGALGLTYSFILESGKLLIGSSSIWYNPEAHLIFQRLNNNPLGVEEFSNTSMVVSPNPSEGIFTVFLENYNQSMEYSISDISGKLIHTGTILSPTYSFDLSLVEDGMYFLSLPGKTFKLLKQ